MSSKVEPATEPYAHYYAKVVGRYKELQPELSSEQAAVQVKWVMRAMAEVTDQIRRREVNRSVRGAR